MYIPDQEHRNKKLHPNNESSSLIDKNTRFLNDVISRSFKREKCIYLRPVDNFSDMESISTQSSITPLEFRKMTGRKSNPHMIFVNFPKNLIDNYNFFSEYDALIMIADMYKKLAFMSNFNTSVFVQRYELATHLLFKTYILSYLTENTYHANYKNEIIMAAIYGEIAHHTNESVYNIKALAQSENRENIMNFLIKHTNYEDASLIINILMNMVSGNVFPSLNITCYMDSVAFIAKGWEETQHYLMEMLFESNYSLMS